MKKTSIVNIIGAGPSGLASAIMLSKAGREVHVHERYETTGKRFQGDLQGLENWTQQEDVLDQFQSFGLDINFEATPFREVIFTDGKYSFQKTSKEPLFYLVKRGALPGSLDTALREQALRHNVQIHYRSHFPESDADILATGPIRTSLIANDKGVVFPTNLPNMAVGIFHDDYAYQGYAYLLVSEGYGCLCTVVFNDLHRLNTCFERTLDLARRMYPINLDKATPVGGLGSFCLNHPRQKEGARLIGEAAGFQDLLWGFGIRTAITSGYLSAQSILHQKDYATLVDEKLEPYLKSSVVNRYLWEKLKVSSTPIIPYFLKIPMSVRTQFRLLYNFTPFHRLFFPLASKYIKKHYPNSIDYSKIENR